MSVSVEAMPDFILDCSCGPCRKLGGASAYDASGAVETTGKTVPFVRRDKENPGTELHTCATCGTTTHWMVTPLFKEQNPWANQMGVNTRLFDPEDLAERGFRSPNGRDWPGEGPFGFRRPALTIGKNASW